MRRQVRSSARRKTSLPRRIVETSVSTIIALTLVSTWHLQCFVVSGASMAETLLGQHRQLVCGDCGATYRCADDEPIMPGKRAVCPNCGAARQRLDEPPAISADGVIVDRSAFLFRSPRRWDLAAFRAPARTAQTFVKRIVGLPGETIELKRGDVYANGEIQRKNLTQLRAMAVPVHDSTHEPISVASRWAPDDATSGWRQNGRRYWHAGTEARKDSDDAKRPIDWLTYHHRVRTGDTVEEAPIIDSLGYNQTRPVTQWHFVRDLMIRCRVRMPPAGNAVWLLTDARSEFLIKIDGQEQTLAIVQDGLQIYRAALAEDVTKAAIVCEVALCDQQVLLAFGGREIATVIYTPPRRPPRPTSRPVAIGTQGGELEVWDLMVLRDVYYTPGIHGRGDPSQDLLANDEYFMLGDNSQHSGDSREWQHPGVSADDLLGKPFAAFPGFVAPGGRQFQVPDFNRFRYIH